MSSDELSDTNVSIKEDNVKEPVGHKALLWHQNEIVKLAAAVRTQDSAEHVEAFDQVDIDWDSIAHKVGFPADKCQQKWKALLSNVRQFRTLSEVAIDVLIGHSKLNVKLANKTRSRSKKLSMNPHHPKKPRINGYSIFCNEKMNSVNLKGTDLMRKIGQMWRELSKEERDSYNLLSKKEKDEYLEKLNTYSEDHPEDEDIQKILAEEKERSHKSSMSKRKKRKLSETDLSEALNESIRDHTENKMDARSTDLHKSPKKKRARIRYTAEDLYVRKKVDSYRLNHPDYKQEKVDAKLRNKFAKMSERKKEKYRQMAANMTDHNAS